MATGALAEIEGTDLTLHTRTEGEDFAVWLVGAMGEDIWILGSGETPHAAEEAARQVLRNMLAALGA
jgi:hypothetical protein